MSRVATRSSDSTRPKACGRSTRSVPRTTMRERMRSRASSTGITRPFYLARRDADAANGLRPSRRPARLLRQIQGGSIASEEPASAQDEEREERRGDEDVDQAVRDLVLHRDRREDQ